jgi:predicted AlkP superfamily phosphohydrolase/phosphomutase
VSQRKLKLLILALDGLDPDLFLNWKDRLPNLSSLASGGFSGRIASTFPPMTFPAWSTFLTGVNPGQHGIFDFTERTPDRSSVRFVNATRRRLPTFLRIASDAGMVVGSVGLPTTYPPEPLSGFQISGFDTPLPSKADSSYIYPHELAKLIDRKLGGYSFGDFNEGRIGPNWHRRVLPKLISGIERKEQLTELLLKEYDLDLLLLHVGETDTVGHHFWSFCDRNSPRYVQNEEGQLSNAISTVYTRTDELVGNILQWSEPEAVMVVSDHGMGGTSDKVLYLNRYLEENGILEFSAGSKHSDRMSELKRLGMKYLPYRLQQKAFHLAGGRIASRIESLQRFGGIEWSNTAAYSEEVNYFPSISLNIVGREPYGIVSLEDADRMVEKVSQALLKWKDPADGSAVVRRVHHCEEVYDGSEIEQAPDLLLEFNQPDGYSYALGRSTSPEGRSPWRKLQSGEYLGRKGGTMNGSHRQHGTFILNTGTDGIKKPVNASLMDAAPTALNILGLGAPGWMEGKSCVRSENRASHYDNRVGESVLYTEGEERLIRKKLIRLGYLE